MSTETAPASAGMRRRPASAPAKAATQVASAPNAPAARADWLLSDIVCEPQRALDLLARWIERDLCRKLVVTVKFKGRESYGILADARALLERAGWARARIKHLQHNKNEVTVMAARSAPDRGGGR